MRADWRADAPDPFRTGEPMAELKTLPTNSIEPTVGRMVHYYDSIGRGPYAAAVTDVEPPCKWSGLPRVRLTVFNLGNFAATSVGPVHLCDSGTGPRFGDRAEWMPYQTRQAAAKDATPEAAAAEAKPAPQYVEARPRTC